MDLAASMAESVERICGIPAREVTPESTLEELGIDSLAAAELITDLEIRLDVELPMDVLRGLNQLRTVGEVTTHLEAGLARRPGS